MLKRSIIAFWITIILGFYPSFAFAADIYVKTPVTRTTINTAIASASPGDVVIIPDGTYNNLSDKNGHPITIAVSGTSGNEITLKAATSSGVKFTGTVRIEVTGSYWIIKDFKFEDIRSYSPSTITISMMGVWGDYIRLSNCYFKNIGVEGDKSLGAVIRHNTGADNGEIDYCTFENWAEIEVISPTNALNLHIHHNYFTNPASADGDSALHIGGDSIAFQTTDSNDIIEYNYFYACNGDPETISSKISSATYRYNVFDGRDNNTKNGALVLRAGDDSIVESNYFYEMGRGSSGSAIRIHGEGHKITNNYIEGTLSGAMSILIASGAHINPQTYGHVRAKNIQVLDNTIVNSNSDGIVIGQWWPTEKNPYDPENLTFENNKITQSTGYLVIDGGHTGTFLWSNNVHYNQGTATYWRIKEAGVREPDSGIIHADFVIQPVQPPISASDVGVSWMRETTVQSPQQLRIEHSDL